jgi:large subunit ribosomal protein L25
MEKVVIKAERREVTGKQVGALRRSGKLPAVIYGRRTEPVNIVLDAHSASLALNKVGSSTLVTVSLDGKEYPALVRERQRDYIKGRLIHVDFLAVSLTEKIRAEVRIELTGVSPAVKDLNAVLVTGLHTLEVECLPTDLPERIVVDISGLAQIGDGIHVRDVTVPEKVRVLDDPDEMVVVATYAKEEVIEEAPAAVEGAVPAEAEVLEPELSVERGKKEEEVPEEGEKAEKTEKPEKAEKKK